MSFHRNHTKNQNAANMHEVKEMLTKECLLDGFLALYEECTHDNLLKIKSVSSFIHKFKNTVYQSKKHRMKASDFEVKAVIGRGHFGEVRVVREKATDAIYAMKVLRKTDLLAQREEMISCYEEERDIMGNSNSASPWITELHFAFQDSCNLYLVMDFHAGGDLLSLLSRHDDIFEEDMAKFYLAETAIAINSLHEMGYLHRDIKPENILLDCTGHVKLADFGSAAKLNSEKKVTAHMPVGTPDYVAPELLNSMSKARQRLTYGSEVDWWSLGVCAYEMLFGATPFSNEHGSMVSTYANIMDFKNSLRFPTESDVSEDGKDLVKKLLTDSHSRLTWTEIKAHPFFKGVNWDTIREGEAVYVPSIHGLDDTSHFDEVETVKRQPDIEAFIQPKDFSGRDLPFVGFTFSKDSPQDSNNSHAVSEQTSISSSNNRLLQKLEEKNQELEKLRAILHKQHISPNDLETRAVSLMENLSAMNDEIRVLEDELLERLEEMQAEIIMLESGHEKLKAQLREKESQLLKTQTSLQDVNNQLQSQQFKLERERRKSREGQHKDLVLLELRNETWESLLADKQASIDELTAKLHELEELVEAYEDSQEKQATQVQELQQKMNSSLHDLSTYTVSDVNLSGDSTQAKVELDNLHHALCPSKKKLTLHVTLKSGRCSILDNKTLNKLQMLQKMVDKYADKAKEWRDKEEELILKISSLESDNNILKQKERMGRKMKDSLMEKVSSYQQEVETQKSIIKDLQGTMRSYLNKSLSVTETESKLKETQQSKLNLESELMSLKEEAERSRHSALQKAKQMEDAIRKLEEQRALAQDYKKRYDCQVEVTEAKVASLEDELTKVTCDRQRLERRETTLAAQEKVFEDLKGLEQQLVVMRSDLTEKEKLIEELRANLHLQTANVADLRNEIEDLMTSENDLVAQLEKEALSNKTLTEENEKLSAKLKECDVSDPRNVEKLQLEIRELTSERDELKVPNLDAVNFVDNDEEETERPQKLQANRPNFYGAVTGVEVGTTWLTRMECCRDGIHRPTVAGIHGGENGAYSIALSGGYEDDVDLGECFIYTGEGGRDLKGTKANPKNLRTAPQSKDQTLTRGNLALNRNVETKNPVRVIRGYKLDSPFAPEEGYRYDGLYTVEKCWFTTGLSGYGVWKFALKRCDDQAPPPWHFSTTPGSPHKSSGKTQDKNSNESQDEDSTSDDDKKHNEASATKCDKKLDETPTPGDDKKQNETSASNGDKNIDETNGDTADERSED